MSFDPVYILAADDGEGLMKLVFFVIFGIIWGISAIVSWVNKKAQQQRARGEIAGAIQRTIDQQQQMNVRAPRRPIAGATAQPRPSSRSAPPPPQRATSIAPGLADRYPDVMLPPAPQPPRAAPSRSRQTPQVPSSRVPVPPQLQPQRRAAAKQSKRRFSAPAPVQPVQVVEERSTVVRTEPRTRESELKRPAPPTVTALSVATWLKPQTMRSQFILTEILQPPLALRDGQR